MTKEILEIVDHPKKEEVDIFLKKHGKPVGYIKQIQWESHDACFTVLFL